ncbi:hypothetical protein C095_01830 [Fusobacterium necrophorum subsp. funduliforme B35]|uniref:Uncharacterized protein n=1 Tax=Fusobacterium necrophorum subsp. funduliforme B35 TaxID=1226633 RepID=A0A0B4FRP7_9FUSO|nr:hypothetical protein C095_01830 [Fusobacterium necrophorum subsp. funduliforme B35]
MEVISFAVEDKLAFLVLESPTVTKIISLLFLFVNLIFQKEKNHLKIIHFETAFFILKYENNM